MAFSLTVQEGNERGRRYSFDQPEVFIGRTSENDLVLEDSGVSRRHAVIRSEGGRHSVEDLGSSNGTQVNGAPVGEESLGSGDLISVGPVVLLFDADEASTRIVDPAELESQRRARRPARPSPSQARATSLQVKAVKPPVPAARPSGRGVSGPPARPRPKAAAPMLASERARLRRENAGPLGRLKVFLIEAPRPVRIGLVAGVSLLGVVLLGAAVVKVAMPEQGMSLARDRSRDVFPLTEEASTEVFGYDADLGVTVQTKDEVRFQFEYSESVPVVYYVRFEAQGIERKDEVEITLNGAHVGFATPNLGDSAKVQRVKLPKKHLKTGIPNELVFDNTENPPGAAPWAIGKVRLAIKPLPAGSAEELKREAQKAYELAVGLFDAKDISAENRFKAWQQLHRSLLCLEAVEPKPDLYALDQAMLRDVDRDLEGVCNKIMLAAKRAEELRDQRRALKEYQNGLAWFPKADDEHPCRARLLEKIDEYGEVEPR